MKKQLLLNAMVLTAMLGWTQSSFALNQSLMNQELSAIPIHSRLVFNSDYTVNTSEDTEFTAACHIEPSTPTGGQVTPAGSVFFVSEVTEVKEGEGSVLVVIGNSKEGNMVMIHCDKASDASERFISVAIKGLKLKLNIDLIIK